MLLPILFITNLFGLLFYLTSLTTTELFKNTIDSKGIINVNIFYYGITILNNKEFHIYIAYKNRDTTIYCKFSNIVTVSC